MKKALVLLSALAIAASAFAAPHKAYPYMGAICADATGGTVYFSDHADRVAYPASVTKLMTALLVLEDVRAKRYGFFDKVTAAPEVARSEASWVGLKAGDRMSVRDLLMALMIHSANDAAIALGVHSAGSFGEFVARMNARAKELGMASTKYYNPNGLPPDASKRYPWKEFNVSTAADQLKLAVQLLKYPEIFEFTSVKTADLIQVAGGYRVNVTRAVNRPDRTTKLAAGEKIVMQLKNHNNIMVKDKLKVRRPDGKEAVDGLKTGYIDAGGSSIVLTGLRDNGTRVIVVVLGSDHHLDAKGKIVWGGKSSEVRDAFARKMLTGEIGK